MRLDILPVIGSPREIIPEDLNVRGVGGSEKMIIELMELLAKNGFEVNYFNDPRIPGDYNGVNYLPNFVFPLDVEDRIVVMFRGYDERIAFSKQKKIIGISTDQYTNQFDYGKYWYPIVDKMVGISKYHKQDHLSRYGNVAEKMQVIDIGLKEEEYKEDLEKINYQCLYCSVPDRGLMYLADYWPEIISKVPDSTLIITSDYRLWGAPDPNNMQYRMRFAGMPGVKFLGKIPRSELIEIQKKSELQLFPCNYMENFCMANQECQAAGCFTITSNAGALETTNSTVGKINNIPSNPAFRDEFIRKTVDFLRLSLDTRRSVQKDIKFKALNRFSWNKILPKWLEVFNG